MTISAHIIGTGAYLPENAVSNDELSKTVDTSDEWIQQRTGIKSRHIAAEGEKTSDMATKAALQALENAGLTGKDIDAVILATTTPDQTFPATAVTVQDNIGMGDHGFGLDVQAVCSGFVYALSVANNFVISGQVKRALVIGADHFTSLLNWDDRTTCVLFGDGAAAVVLEGSEDTSRGVISTHLHSEGRHRDLLYVDGGPSSTQTTGKVQMNGQEVFKHAVTRMSQAVEEALEANQLSPEDVDWLVPHQANRRIIERTVKKLKMPMEKVVLTVDKHGNTSAASIPLALHEAVEDGRIQKNHLLLFEAMGGGLTWASALVRW